MEEVRKWTIEFKYAYFKGLRSGGFTVKEAWERLVEVTAKYKDAYDFICST